MTHDVRASTSTAPDRASRPDTPLRIILAHDLTPRADRATALIAATAWPLGTTVRVVTSPIGIGTGTSSFASAREVLAHHRELHRSIARAHRQVAEELIARGLTVQTEVVEASPAAAIIEEADQGEADLIVVGARDQGRIAAALLGSVATQIMDGARCSVLVSRGLPVERVLLATDGSLPAASAVDIVANWPMFASTQVRALGIVIPPSRYVGQVLSGEEMATAQRDQAEAARATIDRAVAEAVDQLTAARRDVSGRVRTGDPQTQIVKAAREWRSDLVIIGATGQRPLQSSLLGGVARRILHRVSASVLVARRPDDGSPDPRVGA